MIQDCKRNAQTETWTCRQISGEATCAWPHFVAYLGSCGIATVLTPAGAPQANASAKRVIGTLRSECLEHLIVLGETRVRRLLSEYVAFYCHDRPHRSLYLQPPSAAGVRTVAEPVLGGLHHVYSRVA